MFLVNIGPNLAKELNRPTDKDTNLDIPFNTSNSMFLGGVCEREVLEVVRKFKNENSTDGNTIDMTRVKEVTDSVLESVTFICDKSFLTGIFTDKMKMAKMVPIKVIVVTNEITETKIEKTISSTEINKNDN